MTKLKRIFTAGLIMMTVFTMCAVVAPEVKAAASAGDLIKMDGLSSVYYLGADGKRYVFPNESTYFSWYSDFSGVVTVPQSELENYPLGANVTVRPGTKLIKITTNPKVYAVVSGGQLMAVPDEATASALFGANWNKRIVDIADSFFTNYTILSGNVSSTVYPEGSLIKTADGSSIYYIDADGKARMISSESAFLANRFKWSDIVTVATGFVMPTAGDAIDGAISSVVDTSQGGGGVGIIPGAGTGLTVALAADTPSTATVPQNSSVSFLKFNLTASNDGDITVNSIKLTAGGLGTATYVDGVTLYSDGQRVGGNPRDIDSNREAVINFSTPFVIQAGATESILVKAKVSSGTNQHSLNINAASDIVTNGAVVSGSFPVSGNTMSVAAVTVGQLTIAADGAPSNPNLGDEGAILAKFKATNNNVEDIYLNAITLRRYSATSGYNTSSDDDFEGLKLYHEGTLVATAAKDLVGSYVTFTLDTPLLVKKGGTEKFTMQANIIDGPSKTVNFMLYNTVDVDAMGAYYNQSSLVVDSYDGSSLTIQAGAVSLAKVNATNAKTRADQTNVEFGTFKVAVNSGATVELSTLKFTVDTVGETQEPSYISNVEAVINGAVYDLTLESTSSNQAVYSNSDMGVIMLNGATYNIVARADVESTATTQKYTFKINDAVNDLYLKETTNDTHITDITPNSISLKQKQVENPSITISNYALSSAYTAVVGSKDVSAMTIKIKAGEVDDIKVTELSFQDADTDEMSSAIISSLDLYKGDTLVKSKSGSSITGASASPAEVITFDNLNETVSAGKTNNYTLKLNFTSDSTYSNTSAIWKLYGYAAEDKTEGDAIYDAVLDASAAFGVLDTPLASGRTITLAGTGSLYVTMDTTDSSVKKDKYVVAGTTSGYLGAIRLKSDNENVVIEDLPVHATLGDSITTMISGLYLYNSAGLQIASAENIAATTTFENLNLEIGQQSETYYLKADFRPLGKNLAGARNSTYFTVGAIVAAGADSGNALALEAGGACSSGDICYAETTTDTTYDTSCTGNSKQVTMVGINPTSVELVESAAGVSLSDYLNDDATENLAIIKVTANDNNGNTLANGDVLKLVLENIVVKVEKLASTTFSDFTIERIGGGGTAVSSADDTDLNSDATTTDYISFTLSTLTTDTEIESGATAYFLIKGVVNGVGSGTGDDWVKVSLSNFDGTSLGAPILSTDANFKWKDDGISGSASKYALRLSNSSATGYTISEKSN